jgi:ABC-type bacteriocin/lantibiotic exporter with double-glycine peptidase domain
MAVITGLSAYLVIQGDFTIGVFVAYNAMAYLLLAPFNQLISGQMQVSNASGGFDRVNDLLQVAPQVPVPETGAVPPSWDLQVEVASQAYGGLTVLRDVSLRVHEGRFLGLVGAVGSGKSTLINLIAGVLAPTAGSVRVGGLPLEQLGQDLRSHAIVLVPQTDHLVEGTVMDNVTLWDPDLSEQDVTEACRLCLIHDDIVRRPGAYRSRLREGGTDLSGGQRQRIALARAVVRRPRILLLDEATSALDGRTEAAILHNLRGLGITVIFATHRVAALRGADRLVVMDGGQVREDGTPEDLLAAGGLYARLVAASAKGAT